MFFKRVKNASPEKQDRLIACDSFLDHPTLECAGKKMQSGFFKHSSHGSQAFCTLFLHYRSCSYCCVGFQLHLILDLNGEE